MMRLPACVFVAVAVGCSAKPLDPARVRRNLAEHTDRVRWAILQGDHRGLAALTVPAVVDGAGGTEGFVRRVAGFADEARNQGFGFTEVAYSEPSELIESRGAVYAVVPYDLHMTGPGGATGVTPAYLIAVSNDGGRAWKFIDGEGIAGDRAKLLRVLPDFPDRLALPPKQESRWKRPGLLDWIKARTEKPR